MGHSERYVGGMYQGSTPIENRYHFIVDAAARIEAVVRIRNDGDVVTKDLKQTR